MALSTEPPAPAVQSQTQSPLERVILHNLKHQHNWSALAPHSHQTPSSKPKLSTSTSTSSSTSSSAASYSSSLISPLNPTPIPPAAAAAAVAEATKLPLLSGLPPTRIYIHPDEQTAYLRQLSALETELQSVLAQPASEPESESQTQTQDQAQDHATTTISTVAAPDMSSSKAAAQYLRSRIQALTSSYEAPRREFVAGVWKNAAEGLSLAQIAGVFEDIASVLRSEKRERRERDEQQGEDDRVVEDDRVKRFLLAIVDSDSSVVFYVVHDGVVKARQN